MTGFTIFASVALPTMLIAYWKVAFHSPPTPFHRDLYYRKLCLDAELQRLIVQAKINYELALDLEIENRKRMAAAAARLSTSN
jgi:hypothetical protein